MRRLLMAVVSFGVVGSAHAADMPDFLRGSFPAAQTATRNWSGWYVGGQAGYSSTTHGFEPKPHRLDEQYFSQQRPRDADVATLDAGQGQPGWHGFRRVRRPELAMGRYRSRCRGQLQLHQQPRRLVFRLDRPSFIVNPTGETPPPGVTDTYAVTLKGNAARRSKTWSRLGAARAGRSAISCPMHSVVWLLAVWMSSAR